MLPSYELSKKKRIERYMRSAKLKGSLKIRLLPVSGITVLVPIIYNKNKLSSMNYKSVF